MRAKTMRPSRRKQILAFARETMPAYAKDFETLFSVMDMIGNEPALVEPVMLLMAPPKFSPRHLYRLIPSQLWSLHHRSDCAARGRDKGADWRFAMLWNREVINEFQNGMTDFQKWRMLCEKCYQPPVAKEQE